MFSAHFELDPSGISCMVLPSICAIDILPKVSLVSSTEVFVRDSAYLSSFGFVERTDGKLGCDTVVSSLVAC